MSEEKTTIFVNKPGTFLGKKSRRVVVKSVAAKVQEYPLLKSNEIIMVGKGISFSTDLLYQATRLGVPIHFLDRRGRHYATITSPYLNQTVATIRAQMQEANGARGLAIAKAMVVSKLRNQERFLRIQQDRVLHEKQKQVCMQEHINVLCAIRDKLEKYKVVIEEGRKALFSFEGRAANAYWLAFHCFLDEKLLFPGRVGRGAKDTVNVLLNYGYGILSAKVESALISCGLSPFQGFLHADRPGKPSLTLDIMEIFRQPIVDHAVVEYLKRSREIDITNRETFYDFANYVQRRLSARDILLKGKRYTRNYCVYLQAQNIASFLRGEANLKIYESYGDV